MPNAVTTYNHLLDWLSFSLKCIYFHYYIIQFIVFKGFFIFLLLAEAQLWVLDAVPGEVNPENSHEETRDVLHTLQSLPTQIPSRK